MRPEDQHRNVIDSILGHYDRLVLNAEVAAKEYAQLLIRSLITLNAGMAVVFPTFAELFVDDLTAKELLWPSLTAGLGVIFALACGYSVYFNHSYEGSSLHCERESQILQADQSFDKTSFHRNKELRQRDVEYYEEWKSKYDNRRQITYVLGNVLGLISSILFLGSISWFAYTVVY